LELGLAGDACNAFRTALEYSVADDERLEVLPRLAFASQLDAQWEQTLEALNACIRLVAKVNPTAGSHTEFELLLFAARHQSALDFSALLSDVVTCVRAPAAPPDHRVKAAIVALKIATDFGPEDVLDEIYSQVQPLLHHAHVSEASHSELEVIYRTTRGKEVVPVEDLQRFADAARLAEGELAYSNALLTASAACRISARYEEGMAFIKKAFDHAISHKRVGRMSRLLVTELRMHVAAHAYERAEITLKRLTECPIPPGDVFAQSELQTYRARVALDQGDVSTASQAFFSTPDLISPAHSPRRRAHAVALCVRIRLLEGASSTEIAPLVAQLETDHVKLRGLGGQDFEAYSLYLGLCAIGESGKGHCLLKEFAYEARSSKWDLPREIRTVLGNEGRDGECQLALNTNYTASTEPAR
jgi:hypothetical protein